jgi:hypothetical protein
MNSLKGLLAGVAGLIVVAAAGSAQANVIATCTPASVAEVHNDSTGRTNRVHVQCATAVVDGGVNIIFFAMPVTDTAAAARFLSLANTALTAGRQINVEFVSGKSTDFSGTDFGCASSNCRFLVATTLM